MSDKCPCASKAKKSNKKVKRSVPVKAPKNTAPKKSVMRSGEASILGRVMYQF